MGLYQQVCELPFKNAPLCIYYLPWCYNVTSLSPVWSFCLWLLGTGKLLGRVVPVYCLWLGCCVSHFSVMLEALMEGVLYAATQAHCWALHKLSPPCWGSRREMYYSSRLTSDFLASCWILYFYLKDELDWGRLNYIQIKRIREVSYKLINLTDENKLT